MALNALSSFSTKFWWSHSPVLRLSLTRTIPLSVFRFSLHECFTSTFMESSIEFMMKKYFHRRIQKFDEKCKFVKFERKSHHTVGRNSSTLIGQIVYEKDDERRRSEEFFLKVTAPQILFPDGETWQFVNEVHFYTKIRPFFESLRAYESVPKFYAAYLDVGEDWVHDAILLENLEASGYRLSERIPFLDYDQLALMMTKLGEFHAYSFKAKKENPEYFHSLTGVGSHVRLLRESLIPACVERWKAALRPFEHDKRYATAAALVIETVNDKNAVSNYGDVSRSYDTYVLGHCAFDAFNVLFICGEDGKAADAKIVDWQTWMLVSAAMDLLTPLYINASQRMRDEHWDDLIDIYYKSLCTTFADVQIPEKELIVREFALYLPPIFYMMGYRFPYPKKEIGAERPDTGNNDLEKYEDPLVDIFKDVVKRGLLQFGETHAYG